jgi:hypothetical protein
MSNKKGQTLIYSFFFFKTIAASLVTFVTNEYKCWDACFWRCCDVIGGDDDGDGADALACVGFGRFGKTKRLYRKMDGELLVNTEQTSTSSLGVPSPRAV